MISFGMSNSRSFRRKIAKSPQTMAFENNKTLQIIKEKAKNTTIFGLETLVLEIAKSLGKDDKLCN